LVNQETVRWVALRTLDTQFHASNRNCPARRRSPMLSIPTRRSAPLCDSPSRRELLRVGGAAMLGFGLADVLRLEARAAANDKAKDGETVSSGKKPGLPGFGRPRTSY
jgi:hypothetical protein